MAVRIITHECNSRHFVSEILDNDINTLMFKGRYMHNKVAIADKEEVVTGSFNWSK